MNRLHVEQELLNEYKMLLEIPQTREFLYHAMEACKLQFAHYIDQYLENSHKPGEPGFKHSSNGRGSCDLQESRKAVQGKKAQKAPDESSYRFDFHLIYRENQWKPVVDLSESCFELKDLMPDELIERITGHTFAKYKWYYIEKREFCTPNHGVLEFNVKFKYIERDFITGVGEIMGVQGLETGESQSPVGNEEKIIHMNKNRAQMVEIILQDPEACEFLHYFCTFPFYRDMVLENFKARDRHLLWKKFDSHINSEK